MPERLSSRIVSVGAVDHRLRERLFGLYEQAYIGGDRDQFEADLAEKQWVILLEHDAEAVGFSTQSVFEVEYVGRRLRILFSGDTIIAPAYWGSQELVRAWCRLAGRVKGLDPASPLYWYLISKGHRTYMYLPLFFHTFYPHCDRPTPPFERGLMSHLGWLRYGERYDAASGLIDSDAPLDRLRDTLDSAEQRRQNRHVAFFLEQNPRYSDGVELLCLAEIAPENMRSFARREAEAGMSEALHEVA